MQVGGAVGPKDNAVNELVEIVAFKRPGSCLDAVEIEGVLCQRVEVR